MKDQSFCKRELERVLTKGDFHRIPHSDRELYKSEVIKSAQSTALNLFSDGTPLHSFKLKDKIIFHLPDLPNELVVRKTCQNLKETHSIKGLGRAEIIENLSLLLAEGVPYNVYRLDVSNFYESFKRNCILSELDNDLVLAYQTKLIVKNLLTLHSNLGGEGVPRGLALGAILSDRLMAKFDIELQRDHRTFFYARYVDDIIFITDGSEDTLKFIDEISEKLPDGLKLNRKKTSVIEVKDKVSPRKKDSDPEVLLCDFDYLGYKFKVYEPLQIAKQKVFRKIEIDIASKKIKKIKSRIVGSYYPHT